MQRNILATVFVTGAVALVIEIVALRALAPTFGNTIFTSSSVIGIFLAALSLGYWWGGKIADRRPETRVFFTVVFLAGLATLLIVMLGRLLLPLLGATLSIMSGPPLAALLLFFLPGLLLGMLSPLAIRLLLADQSVAQAGTTSGLVFFWSTAGSILGTLLAGYVLIPTLAIPTIFIGAGGLLLVIGLIGLGIGRTGRTTLLPVALVALLGSLLASPPATALYQKNGVYEQITIYDGTRAGRPLRFLQLDHNYSSARYLDDPTDHVFPYTRYARLHELLVPDLRRALVLGAGAFTIPQAIARARPAAQINVIDIEPTLPALGERFFGVTPNPNLRAITADGRRFLADAPDRYDLIMSDVYYSLHAVPPHFTTREFFELAADRLTPTGIVIVNLIGTLDTDYPSFVPAEIKTFRSVFPNALLFAVEDPASTDLQNIILVGGGSDQKLDLSATAGNADPFFQTLTEKRIDPTTLALDPLPILTDTYAPVEYFMAQTLRRFPLR